jgi:transcriptional regulator with XRE-family HTH domain
MKIIENIKTLRLQNRLSQEFMADSIGCDTSAYNRIENGKQELRLSQIALIAKILNVSEIDLYTYPEIYVPKKSIKGEPIKATLQIELPGDKRDQVFKLMFGENNLEILNR